ncbi:MAG: prepilin-type N-terminal cleavage/methylation domain-containing protein, partial [Gemmatimonadales bacterium]|nr:prepilin-type N-terminal cleavage/methylation domain-containing protein [Gemmatimonadales bacterium]
MRRRGFTLIELLVVIAIIGILASMVFPVFARARESARKAVCLSNIKNIALAIQMYLTDNNDTLPPQEHRPIADDYEAVACSEEGWNPVAATFANPYLRWPVVLDEYLRNREVWMCPSAKVFGGATGINPDPDWFGWLDVHSEEVWGWSTSWGEGVFCWWNGAWYPPGWGGAVTDSSVQGPAWGRYEGGETRDNTTKVFRMSIACNAGTPVGSERVTGGPSNWDRKLVTVPDPV